MGAAEAPPDQDVADLLRGDVRAFERTFHAIQPALLRYLGSLVADEAQDVAGETWLQVTRDLRTFRGDGADFRRWVVQIGRNRALDHLRARGRRPFDAVDPRELPEVGTDDSTFGQASESMATERALALIRRLPRDQAEALLLRVVVGLDAPAAARVLRKRPGAVRMATSRGLQRLREIVEAEQGVTLPDSLTL
ncbi:MAG: hypothetical protein QOJ92_855 [Frankiales bacterium]|jgi:RNA polymerase sigma-70 factor (ECF subfamily)|nr:hypothetical protein [Frankiales bacterium]